MGFSPILSTIRLRVLLALSHIAKENIPIQLAIVFSIPHASKPANNVSVSEVPNQLDDLFSLTRFCLNFIWL